MKDNSPLVGHDHYLFTYRELCDKFRLSSSTVQRLVKRGELAPPIQLSPRRVVFLGKNVRKFLEAKEKQALKTGGRK